jgi:membrane protein required for beta-lactamase induction
MRARKLPAVLVDVFVVVQLLVLATPVFLIAWYLQQRQPGWNPMYLLFAVLVIFLCLGPRDLGAEVEEYCRALDDGDEETARRVLVELSEEERPWAGESGIAEEAIFVQAPHRIFGVVFWFILLGPVGAWLFRISDLLRRRAAFEFAREPDAWRQVLPAVERVYGLLNWIPTRLAALGFALSGSFDEAVAGWRAHRQADAQPFRSGNDRLAARVGKGAMSGFLDQPPNSSGAARNAMRLVSRTLFIWVTVIAVLTIFGWAV